MTNDDTKLTLKDYDYEITEDRIAQYPLANRTDSRMLVVNASNDRIEESVFCDLELFLKPNDLLVFNDTRVVPARLYGRKQTGGKIEALIERFINDHRVLAHIRASKAPQPGSILFFENDGIQAVVVSRQADLFELQFPESENIFHWLKLHGHIPLPPYIAREAEAVDAERYQTVFARHDGAVAAPTAGLHFDEAIIDRLKKHGVMTASVTLHVGAGTFQPVRGDDLEQHHMHSEYIEVSSAVCEAVTQCHENNGRVIAVGTTVCRCLEAASTSGVLLPFSGDTDLFIKPGFKFNCTDGLITNFHLPKSTLLVLVSTFSGYNLMKRAYQYGLDHAFRFFSYGDLMLIVK